MLLTISNANAGPVVEAVIQGLDELYDVKLIEKKESVLVIERRARGDTTRATDLPVPIESILNQVENLSKLVVKRGKLNKMKRISRSFFALPLTRLRPIQALERERGMSFFSHDTLRPPSSRQASNPAPPQSLSPPSLTATDRQRSSSFSLPNSTHSSFRRRSSANNATQPLIRKDSQNTTLGGGTVPPLKTLDSYNARNVAAALDQGLDQGRMIDDVWQSVCVRVLPLL